VEVKHREHVLEMENYYSTWEESERDRVLREMGFRG
jgi:hypothetical protein